MVTPSTPVESIMSFASLAAEAVEPCGPLPGLGVKNRSGADFFAKRSRRRNGDLQSWLPRLSPNSLLLLLDVRPVFENLLTLVLRTVNFLDSGSDKSKYCGGPATVDDCGSEGGG